MLYVQTCVLFWIWMQLWLLSRSYVLMCCKYIWSGDAGDRIWDSVVQVTPRETTTTSSVRDDSSNWQELNSLTLVCSPALRAALGFHPPALCPDDWLSTLAAVDESKACEEIRWNIARDSITSSSVISPLTNMSSQGENMDRCSSWQGLPLMLVLGDD